MTPVGRAPRWAAPASTTLAVVGLLVSAYLTVEHFTQGSTLACPEGEVVNCAVVTASSYAYLAGIPVALLGLLFYAVLLPLSLPRAWASPDRRLDWARLGLCAVGLVFVFYLVWAELYRINAICLWCTGVHVVTFLLFCVVLFAQMLREPVVVTRGRTAARRAR